jgi:hypothetical protein
MITFRGRYKDVDVYYRRDSGCKELKPVSVLILKGPESASLLTCRRLAL